MAKPIAEVHWGPYGRKFFVGITAGGSTKIRYFANKASARKAASELIKAMRRIGAKVRLTRVGGNG